MRITVIGHSMVHARQQQFWRHAARQGHDVTLIGPLQWGKLCMEDRTERLTEPMRGGVSAQYGLPAIHMGGNLQDGFVLLNLTGTLERAQPDLVYVNQEPHSRLAAQVRTWCLGQQVPYALFTWENLGEVPEAAHAVLRDAALVVGGNDDAQQRVAPFARRTHIDLQVGVDTDHFQARPGHPRDTRVAFFGRKDAPEKGVTDLLQAWPTATIADWVDWRRLPWAYTETQVVVVPSKDTPYWREQAPPYVAVEALATGCAVVAYASGSIPFWLRRFSGYCDGVDLIEPGDLEDLRRGIQWCLDYPEARDRRVALGREWVIAHLSSPVVAQRLLDQFRAVLDG